MHAQRLKTLKMYALAGIVTSVEARAGRITIHNAHAPVLGTPLEREYTLQDKNEVGKSKAGDFVRATLLTDNADVWLLEDVRFVTKRIRHTA